MQLQLHAATATDSNKFHLQIKRAGFSYPTPIQAQAWPVAMAGRDLVAIAKTGSGKTCGFLLPGMLHINATRKVRCRTLQSLRLHICNAHQRTIQACYLLIQFC